MELSHLLKFLPASSEVIGFLLFHSPLVFVHASALLVIDTPSPSPKLHDLLEPQNTDLPVTFRCHCHLISEWLLPKALPCRAWNSQAVSALNRCFLSRCRSDNPPSASEPSRTTASASQPETPCSPAGSPSWISSLPTDAFLRRRHRLRSHNPWNRSRRLCSKSWHRRLVRRRRRAGVAPAPLRRWASDDVVGLRAFQRWIAFFGAFCPAGASWTGVSRAVQRRRLRLLSTGSPDGRSASSVLVWWRWMWRWKGSRCNSSPGRWRRSFRIGTSAREGTTAPETAQFSGTR